VVAFSVSASGGLAGVSIARSSGSAALDAAALRMVQRAAPFPPPPKGAQRSFSISIKGR
jgi:protein TonB